MSEQKLEGWAWNEVAKEEFWRLAQEAGYLHAGTIRDAVGSVSAMAKSRNQNGMPDIPKLDFIGALCEIWSGLNYAAYHLAYVRVYLQTAALQTDADQLRMEEQILRDMGQVDVVVCRTHLAAFFWQLDHVFRGTGGSNHSRSKGIPYPEVFLELRGAPERNSANLHLRIALASSENQPVLVLELPHAVSRWLRKGGRTETGQNSIRPTQRFA